MKTPEQNRENQRRWYEKNRQKVSEKKKMLYQKDIPKFLAKNKEYRLKKMQERLDKMQLEKLQLPKYSLFEILDILRKDIKHYLWNKYVAQWQDADWIKFEILKNK